MKDSEKVRTGLSGLHQQGGRWEVAHEHYKRFVASREFALS